MTATMPKAIAQYLRGMSGAAVMRSSISRSVSTVR